MDIAALYVAPTSNGKVSVSSCQMSSPNLVKTSQFDIKHFYFVNKFKGDKHPSDILR